MQQFGRANTAPKCLGPLELYGGDSGGSAYPKRIQNKRFEPLVFPLGGYTIYSIMQATNQNSSLVATQ